MVSLRSTDRIRLDVVDAIMRADGASQVALGSTLDLNRSGVSRAIEDLRHLRVLPAKEQELERGLDSGRAGRRRRIEHIREDLGVFIGVAIDPGSDSNGSVVATAVDSHGSSVWPDAYMAVSLDDTDLHSVVRACSVAISEVLALVGGVGSISSSPSVGVTVGGQIDAKGRVLCSPNLGWVLADGPVALAEKLRGSTKISNVFVENDVNALALYEQWFGVARSDTSFAVVTADHHIGSALVLDGALWRGSFSMAGEIGHIPALRLAGDEELGPKCVCGNHGCLEMVAALPSLLLLARERHVDSRESIRLLTDVERLASDGDDALRLALHLCGQQLGAAVATLINLSDVGSVYLYGEMFTAGQVVCESVLGAIQGSVFPSGSGINIEYSGTLNSSSIGRSEADDWLPRTAEPGGVSEPPQRRVVVCSDTDPVRFPRAAAALAIRRQLERMARKELMPTKSQ
jgi:predicted NBD/HSP70 family sugar kinase